MTDPKAIQAAQNLTNAYKENTATLNKILWRNRILMTIAAVQLAGFGFLGLGYRNLNQTTDKVSASQQAACEEGNKVRTGLLRVADKLEEFNRLDPNGQSQASKDFIVELRTDFALRQCEVK